MIRCSWSLCAAVCALVLGAVATPALARPGDLDPTFSTDGFAQVTFEDVEGYISEPDGYGLAPIGLASDGDVLLGSGVLLRSESCSSNIGCFGDARARLARLNPDGSLDRTLGGDGTVQSAFGQTDATAGGGSGLYPYAYGVDAAGRILIASTAINDGIVLRVNENGELDQSFGAGGRQTIDLGQTGVAIADVIVDDQGRILLAGKVDSGSTSTEKDGLIVRLLPNGSVDSSFGGGDGIVTVNVTALDSVERLAVDASGRIVGVGYNWDGSPFNVNLTVMQLLPDGSLDPEFGGGDGLVTHDPRPDVGSNTEVKSLEVDSLGRPLVSITTVLDYTALPRPSPSVFHYLLRLDDQGNPDTSLGPNGVREVALPGSLVSSSLGSGDMVLAPDGHIVIGGTADSPVVARLTPDGAPDESFGVAGIAQVYSPVGPSSGGGVLIDGAGRIILGGSTRERHPRAQITAFRTDANPPDDADADGTPTARDRCPGLYGTRDGCPSHRRKLTLRQTRKGLAGTVSSRWVDCVTPARVNIFANVNGRDPRVAKARPVGGIDPVDAGERAFARWTVKKLPTAKTLYAVVRQTDDPAAGLCSLATSRPLTVH